MSIQKRYAWSVALDGAVGISHPLLAFLLLCELGDLSTQALTLSVFLFVVLSSHLQSQLQLVHLLLQLGFQLQECSRPPLFNTCY